MVSTDLGACEWFVWDLRRSNLIDRGQLDQIVGEFLEKHPLAEPPALAEYLVAKNILTKFQADRLLEGKTQGFVLGPYTLKDALGAGSMGTVYKALSKNDNQWYAVKVLPRRSMWNVRLARRKVRAFESCKHPAVVPFLDVGTAGGMHYLSWPLVEGETLEKIVQRDGKLKPDQAVGFALQTAEGLDACHQQGLFHGLLKPSNIMIGPDQQVHIVDLGIGALLAETEGESLVDTMSTANSVASGLDCASPESIMDPTNLTPIGDQYSLGCVLYFCLTGQYPFPDGAAAEKMMAHQFKQPKPIAELVPELPRELVALVERLMQKKPEERFANTAEAIEALQGLGLAQVVNLPASNRVQVNQSQAPARATAPAPHGDAKAARTRPDIASAPKPATSAARLPTRQSLNGTTAPAKQGPSYNPPPDSKPREPVTPKPAASGPKLERTLPRPGGQEYVDGTPSWTWEERLGPVGIAVSALIMCVLAWLLTWKLF